MKDPEALTAKEKKTLFYKLFGMSKRQWDLQVKMHQKKLNRREREYFLSFRQHSKGDK
jgi:AraC-like DNA-binding protein